MAKIIDTINAKLQAGESFYSFEFFPPKTEDVSILRTFYLSYFMIIITIE